MTVLPRRKPPLTVAPLSVSVNSPLLTGTALVSKGPATKLLPAGSAAMRNRKS